MLLLRTLRTPLVCAVAVLCTSVLAYGQSGQEIVAFSMTDEPPSSNVNQAGSTVLRDTPRAASAPRTVKSQNTQKDAAKGKGGRLLNRVRQNHGKSYSPAKSADNGKAASSSKSGHSRLSCLLRNRDDKDKGDGGKGKTDNSKADGGKGKGKGDSCPVGCWRTGDARQLMPYPVAGIRFGGWVETGISVNNRSALNPAAGNGNYPVAFNYRHREVQVNQLYGFLEKQTDTGGSGWDIGGRIDFLGGDDYLFTQATGLETDQDGNPDWNAATGDGLFGVGRMGIAMPQAYIDIAANNLNVKIGHFYTIIGYETVTAPDNFFYSHSYQMLYAEPFTHTGILAELGLGDRWSLLAGYHLGWDVFDRREDRGAFLGGLTWTSRSERTAVAVAFTLGDEQDNIGGFSTRSMGSLVVSQRLGKRLEYVLHCDMGQQDAGVSATQDAAWYGFGNYLYYTINDCLKAGVRYEYFKDQQGMRVIGTPGFAGQYQELTAGINWRPLPNVTFRPEMRWDWFNSTNPALAPIFGPYNSGRERNQFTAAIDLIITF